MEYITIKRRYKIQRKWLISKIRIKQCVTVWVNPKPRLHGLLKVIIFGSPNHFEIWVLDCKMWFESFDNKNLFFVKNFFFLMVLIEKKVYQQLDYKNG